MPTRDAGFTVEDICMLRHRDRGSTTSLGSDFSLVLEHSPGAVGSFSYEAVELVPAGAPTQAAWRKSHSSSPQSMLWSRPQPSEDRLPSHHGLTEAKSSSSSSSNHSDNFFRMGSSPLEVPKPRLTALSDRETRLQEVRSAFLAAYSSTVRLRAAAPSPSGAIGGLLEQFARGVGLRGTSTSAL